MRKAIIQALEDRYKAQISEADATLKIFLDYSVGIGEHAQHIEEMDDDSTSALLISAKKVSERIRNTLNYPATTIGINNGPEAGQEIGHVHIHIIPRKESEDGGGPFSIVLANGRINKPTDEELDELSKQLEF